MRIKNIKTSKYIRCSGTFTIKLLFFKIPIIAKFYISSSYCSQFTENKLQFSSEFAQQIDIQSFLSSK